MVRRKGGDDESGDEVGEEDAIEAAFEAEKVRLQRQLRVMDNDRRAYTEDTQNFIRKQRSQIKSLMKENKELSTVLRLAESDRNYNLDENNKMIIHDLIENMDTYKKHGDKERDKILKLDEEIMNTEKEIINQRRIVGGGTDETTEQMTQKTTSVLENRLDNRKVKFNEQLAINRSLRDEIDNIRQDKSKLDAIFNKLNKELLQLRKDTSVYVEKASQAYEQRDEAHNKTVALKERSEKDQSQHKMEMKELQRAIDHDNKLKEFMMVKANDRADYKEEEEEKKKKMKRDGDLGVETALIETFEDAFEEIRKITSHDDIYTITSDFIRKENENFALFNFVNELNNEVDKLHEDITKTQEDIVRFEKDDVTMEADQRHYYREFKIQSKCAREEAEIVHGRISQSSETTKKLITGVESMFDCLMCDRSALNEMLGCEDGVTDKNILLYMGIIEHRTMDLLHIKHYIDMKKADPEKDIKDFRNKEAVDVVKEKSVHHVSIKAPVIREEDEPIDEEQGLRPLCYDELRYQVRRKMDRESEMRLMSTPTKDTPTSKSA